MWHVVEDIMRKLSKMSEQKAGFEEMILEALSKAADERRDKDLKTLNDRREAIIGDLKSAHDNHTHESPDKMVAMGISYGLFSTTGDAWRYIALYQQSKL